MVQRYKLFSIHHRTFTADMSGKAAADEWDKTFDKAVTVRRNKVMLHIPGEIAWSRFRR